MLSDTICPFSRGQQEELLERHLNTSRHFLICVRGQQSKTSRARHKNDSRHKFDVQRYRQLIERTQKEMLSTQFVSQETEQQTDERTQNTSDLRL
ncbi:hypothetical protein AVEN_128804-1 [Araneus ventricosus]|uniref:Uncharacterized protein n=1 Tax=Araneus ventricosus TaxID=182803 RepID=A0A4Y2VV11_ARAVE|nr:hypothetical protein AVEN_128804-1 [Araneus ventricosus]